MGAQIGLDSTVQISKILLRQFCGRYTGSQDVDFYFTHSSLRLQEQRPPWRQPPLLPRFTCRHFSTRQGTTTAKSSSCRVVSMAFLADADVVDAAARLPPPLKAIRKQVALTMPQKEALRERGINTTTFARDILERVYMAFRPMG